MFPFNHVLKYKIYVTSNYTYKEFVLIFTKGVLLLQLKSTEFPERR